MRIPEFPCELQAEFSPIPEIFGNSLFYKGLTDSRYVDTSSPMTSPNPATLGPALRKFREALGKSGKDFAAIAGMSQGHLSEVEQGRRNLTAALITRLAAGLEISEPDLIAKLSEMMPAVQPEPESPVMREEPAVYRTRATQTQWISEVDECRALTKYLMRALPKSEVWKLVHQLTDAAEAGDLLAGKCAKTLLVLLSEPE
jgi:hypothetical protein